MTRGEQARRRATPLALCTAVLLVVAGLAYSRPEPVQSHDRFYLRSGSGAVIFTHGDHARRAEGCITCHHDLAGERVAKCADCHDDEDYEPGMMKHSELLEIEDHECSGCHRIAADDKARSCRSCHKADEIADRYHRQCNTCHLSRLPDRFADGDGEARCSVCHLK